ncbi:type VII secretion protein EccB [Nocardioides sp.]|uniref:type VII secretion protein EccB n=1 Tax=Nocardioides sp. TaxID=35761 RepID=UPI0031FEE402|nr:hypothetical protein [Nocardioides sp.]
MATKRDLVEAHAFSRRRLITAFVSGAPGGREVEPTRPARTVVGGLALAMLVVAGAAIAGVFAPRTPDNWTDPGLVISKEKGAAYVILDAQTSAPELRPLINITSAQLILGADIEPRIIAQDDIDGETVGDDIGIFGAPASPPQQDKLIETGWTACTGDGLGIKVDVSTAAEVQPVPHSGFAVRSAGRTYVVAQGEPSGEEAPRAYAYEVSRVGSDEDNLLNAIGFPGQAQAPTVPADWIRLFPPGGRLGFDTFGITGFGDPAPGAGQGTGLPSDARLGDYIPVGDGALLLTAQGPVELDAFALAVYRNVALPGGADARELALDEPPSLAQAPSPLAVAHWPAQPLTREPGQTCALLQPVAGSAPAVQVATDPTGNASATEVAAGRKELWVDKGRGAYVLSGTWDDTTGGRPFVIDNKALRYELVGPGVADRLGYGGYAVPVVPDPWVELFRPGVPLSIDAALCPPSAETPTGSSCG